MIERIHVKNLLTIRELAYQEVTPITVIIGDNDTGKTGLLKLLYAASKALAEIDAADTKPAIKTKLGDKITSTFFPRRGGIGSLVTKGADAGLEATISFYGDEHFPLHFGFSKDAAKEPGFATPYTRAFAQDMKALFIPAKEVLTTFRAIALSRERFEVEEFDDTYYDLIKALRVPTKQGKTFAKLSLLNDELLDIFDGEIVQSKDEKNPFMFRRGKTEFPMTLTAEGIKKIGILTTLIRNRELGANTLLFLDEPETALHPKAQRRLAELLFQLTQIRGVKVFLATHSYFMTSQFANIARREKRAMTCLSLERGEDQGVSVQHFDLQEGLPENSIITEAQLMFRESMKIELGL